jgi:23S rRNA (adenine2030-N6)-methyltransferase
MLSYRHSYHAGNFADVLKHIVEIESLKYLTKKNKPLCYVDTHSGAGGYQLLEDKAQKTKEFEAGIGKIWGKEDGPQAVLSYLDMIQKFNNEQVGPMDKLTSYPGSPWLAANILREQDSLFLHELHTTDEELLRDSFYADRRASVFKRDGFKSMISLLPPKERRAFILIDPSYEIKEDYELVVDSVLKSIRRFAQGVFAIWVPVVDRERLDQMEYEFEQSGVKRIHVFELAQKEDTEESGMTSSAMIVINPPWGLVESVDEALEYLSGYLCQGDGFYRSEELVGE